MLLSVLDPEGAERRRGRRLRRRTYQNKVHNHNVYYLSAIISKVLYICRVQILSGI